MFSCPLEQVGDRASLNRYRTDGLDPRRSPPAPRGNNPPPTYRDNTPFARANASVGYSPSALMGRPDWAEAFPETRNCFVR